MKRTIIIVALLLIAVSLYTWQKSSNQAVVVTPQPSPVSVDTTNWKTYRNEQYGFEIKYPESAAIEVKNGIIEFWNKHTLELLKSEAIPEAFPLVSIWTIQPAPPQINESWLNQGVGSSMKLRNHKESIGGREALVAENEEWGGSKTLIIPLKASVLFVETLDDIPGTTDFPLSNQILSTFKFTK